MADAERGIRVKISYYEMVWSFFIMCQSRVMAVAIDSASHANLISLKPNWRNWRQLDSNKLSSLCQKVFRLKKHWIV